MKFIGDVHGKYQRYATLIKHNPDTFQVGDMGIGFRRQYGERRGEFFAAPPHAKMVKSNARFIRGNHDNPQACSWHSQFISDGTVIDDCMFIGGAFSIDWNIWDDKLKKIVPWRTDGYNGWKDEEISIESIPLLGDIYKSVKPRIMATHDCPVVQANAIHGSHHRFDSSRTQLFLQALFEVHQPDIWVHGHHHISTDHKIEGCRFICLAELEMKDV